ncbi:hypothetical protein BH11PSE10_BH11PSE10_21840 [soil metagenome]
MSWLGDKLRAARDAIRAQFQPAPPAAVATPCAAPKKTLHTVTRHGTSVFKRDADGAILAKTVGAPFNSGHGGAPGVQFRLQQYELELLDGSKVEAYKSLGRVDGETLVPDARMDTDCHGVTFTNGEYWINDDQVDRILLGGGLTRKATAVPGDVLVYRSSDGGVSHSVTVTAAGGAGVPTQVSGLGGIEMAEHYDTPATGWHDTTASHEYWSP